MQVSLISKRGLPDDAIISIRSGAVRRQGAVSAGKPFCFPQMSEGDCVVKVDIMQNIGSGYIVMRPNQQEGKQYEVSLGSADMACELEISPTDGSTATPEAQEDATAAKTKQDAKVYLEGTGLLPFVQGVLQVVAKQQPQDPFAAMAKHFNSASDVAVAPTPEGPKVAPAVPKSAPASPKAEAKAETPADTTGEVVAEATAEATPAEGSEEKAAPPVEQPAAEAEGGQAPAAAEEEEVDDHKSDVLEVQFTASLKGKDLSAEGNGATAEEPPAEAAQGEAQAAEAAAQAAEAAAEEAPKQEVAEAVDGEAQATEVQATEEAIEVAGNSEPAATGGAQESPTEATQEEDATKEAGNQQEEAAEPSKEGGES